jgi:hypothetical protein
MNDLYQPCKGMNCGCTDGVSHSSECRAEHAAAVAGGRFVKDGGKGEAVCDRIICWHNRSCVNDDAATMRNCPHRAAPQAECAPREAQPKLSVWYGSLPESNGKTNWTAILHRGDVTEGITIDISEYPDRTRYEADRMRWMIGELADEPWILDYDADKHSGYATPTPERAQPVGPRTTLNYDGTFDTTCAHCGGNGCFACLKSAAPTPERAQTISDAMMDLVDRLGSEASEVDPRAWKSLLVYAPERADAGKDAALDKLVAEQERLGLYDEPRALTDEQIRRIWLIETGTTEQDSPLAILDFARAIEQAVKERK